MSVGDDRIRFEVRAPVAAGPDLAAVFIGHCPGAVSRAALSADTDLAEELAAAGHAERVSRWPALATDTTLPADELYGLALPIRSLAQLQRLFPDIQLGDARPPGQAVHWLPWAVQDYFAAGDSAIDRRLCWVIRVQEGTGLNESLDAFAARPGAVRHEPDTWGPLELACALPDAGLLVLPDLERLLVPVAADGVAKVRLPNPSPEFHPCSANLDDDHRERRTSSEMPPRPAPDLQTVGRLRAVAARVHNWRPDLQWLFALSAESDGGLPLPRPQPDLLNWLRGARNDESEAPALAQAQFLFPLVYGDRRGERRPLGTPSGLIAGHIVHRTGRDGVWRSVAGVPLSERLLPWPALSRPARAGLRDDPGLGVLYPRAGALTLDDERLVASGFCDHAGSACRSGELMRFVGWLKRALRRLGEDMLFRVDGRDPAIAAMLDAFLHALFRNGALRGASPADAYRVTRVAAPPERIEYRIEIAPSFPVDRFVVTFLHERDANSPQWLWELAGG